MADYDKLPSGKDQNAEAGLIINGVYHSNSDLLKALAKALIKKGVVSKAEILAEI